MQDRLRSLPAVDRVLGLLRGEDAEPETIADAARAAVDAARARILEGAEPPTVDEVAADARARLEEERRSRLQPVLNATGVLIHTNLGRSPLGDEQLKAVARVAGAYSNLEYDLAAGRRGDRYSHATRLLRRATGAEAALVVNNNAAAVTLVLAALCTGREVVISRGELIEIGGEFRIPEVMAASGARLAEVGTTNRTHLRDYERAIGPATAAILKVHPSNYQVVGFTASVAARDLARLARGRGVLFIHDLGSGFLGAATDAAWAAGEPPVEVALSEGSDVVTFSGDKLFGGPQAGVVAGRADLIARIARHPLLRAVRVDKMTLAALETTLGAYLRGAVGELPLWKMALTREDELERRARRLADAIAARAPDTVKVEAVPTRATAGGGSVPGTHIPSWGIALSHAERGPQDVEADLRAVTPPVIARVTDDRVVLDLRTVDPAADELLSDLMERALRRDG